MPVSSLHNRLQVTALCALAMLPLGACAATGKVRVCEAAPVLEAATEPTSTPLRRPWIRRPEAREPGSAEPVCESTTGRVRVVGSDGEPVPDALVSLSAPCREPRVESESFLEGLSRFSSQLSWTDQQGRAVFTGLDFDVDYSATTSPRGMTQLEPLVVRLEAGTQATEVQLDVVAKEPHEFRVVDQHGDAVAGAAVQLWEQSVGDDDAATWGRSWSFLGAPATTGADGRVTVAYAREIPRRYRVRISRPDREYRILRRSYRQLSPGLREIRVEREWSPLTERGMGK